MDVFGDRMHEYLEQQEIDMNGVTDGYAAWLGDHDPEDDAAIPQPTDVECPFCGHDLEWDGVLFCDDCELSWKDSAAVDRDRVTPADPWDALTEAQQDMHVWGGGR